MTVGALDVVVAPAGWSWRALWTVAPRVKETGRPDWQPLSVFLDAGVVPRNARDDNHNQLGEDLSRYLVVRPGDIVFNKLRTWQGGLGMSEYAGIVSPAYFVCRPQGEADPRFLHYLLRSAPYLAELARISKWMPPSQFDIPWDNLRSLRLLLPTLDEQRRIADFLDAETRRIERTRGILQRQEQLLEAYAYAHLSDTLVPGSLSSTQRHPRWPWLPMLPEDLPLVRLGYLSGIQSGLTIDSGRDSGTDALSRPYLRVANVQAGSLDLSDVSEVAVSRPIAARCTLQPGDVLMTEGGDLDKLGRGTVWRGELPNCLHQNHVFALRPFSDRLDSDYLAMVTRTFHGRCYFESTGARTTNLASTNSSKIRGFPVPLPPISTQRSLVKGLSDMLTTVECARSSIARQLDLLTERKRALTTAAVTGKIDVTTAREVA